MEHPEHIFTFLRGREPRSIPNITRFACISALLSAMSVTSYERERERETIHWRRVGQGRKPRLPLAVSYEFGIVDGKYVHRIRYRD